MISFVRRRTDPVGYARSIGVNVGHDCRLLDVTFSTEPYLIHIGDHVSATKTHFETHDGGVWPLRGEFPEIDIVRPVHIGNNVYLGYGCIVLPGVTIGNNTIVGAGSIVTRDIPENSVCAGIPARVIKTLDEYSSNALRSAHMTKNLTPKEKRDYYTQLYSANTPIKDGPP